MPARHPSIHSRRTTSDSAAVSARPGRLATLLLGAALAPMLAVPAQPAGTRGTTQVTSRAQAAAEAPLPVPAGRYTLDRSHASLLFSVDHLGFSHYTARFRRFDATLQFDPARLAASQVEVSVEANSIETDFPDPAKLDFNAQLQGTDWLDAVRHPRMTYRSKRIVPTGDRTFRIEGELTLRGVTRPVTLEGRYNGGYAGHPMDPHARIGFSATGRLRRSVFGMTYGIPAPGTTMGVGDAVDLRIECEFSGPPLPTNEQARGNRPK